MQQIVPRYFLRSVLLLFLCAASAGSVLADNLGIPVEPTTVTISPEMPKLAEPVQVTVAGTWSDACVPDYIAHQIVDDLVTITTATPGPEVVCGQAYTPWAFHVALGALSHDQYRVEVGGAVIVTTTFMILEHQVYLPLIGN